MEPNNISNKSKEKDSKTLSSSHFYPKGTKGPINPKSSIKKPSVLDNMHLKADLYDGSDITNSKLSLSINNNNKEKIFNSNMNDLFNKKLVNNMVQYDTSPLLDSGEFISRPVCRKKEPTEQLEDLDNTVEKRFINKRPISTSNLMRPPSRHKTPPKALGLDIPIDNISYEKLKIETLIKKRPNTSKPSFKSNNNQPYNSALGIGIGLNLNINQNSGNKK